MTLSINQLTFERNNRLLFSNLSTSIGSGELLQIKGANGCGKSTLLRMLGGFIEPQEGQIIWQEQSISEQRDTYQQQLHYVGHQNGIKPYLTVFENLQLSCALSNIQNDTLQIKNILKKMNLHQVTDSQAMHLSAGQTRRLALARLLLRPVALWLLDEPTTSLDSEAQGLLKELIEQHLQQDGICVVATHQHLPIPGKILELGGRHV